MAGPLPRRGKGGMSVVMDEDEGWSAKRWVPSSERAALLGLTAARTGVQTGEYLGHTTAPENRTMQFQCMDQEDVEAEARRRSKALSEDTLALCHVAAQARGVQSEIATSLVNQGKQIERVHGKLVPLSQELDNGENLLRKLGPMLQRPWWMKRGGRIQGPKEAYPGDSYNPARAQDTEALRSHKLLDLTNADKGSDSLPVMDALAADRERDDAAMDFVVETLDEILQQAKLIEQELAVQDDMLGNVTKEMAETQSRVESCNKRLNWLKRR